MQCYRNNADNKYWFTASFSTWFIFLGLDLSQNCGVDMPFHDEFPSVIVRIQTCNQQEWKSSAQQRKRL